MSRNVRRQNTGCLELAEERSRSHGKGLRCALILVGHVLPRLARPDEVEGVVREVHLQRIHNPVEREEEPSFQSGGGIV